VLDAVKSGVDAVKPAVVDAEMRALCIELGIQSSPVVMATIVPCVCVGSRKTAEL
jgi:hypothetical protein